MVALGKRSLQSPLEVLRCRRSLIRAASDQLLLQVNLGPEKPRSTNPLLSINYRISCEEASETGRPPLLSDSDVTKLKSPRHNQPSPNAAAILASWGIFVSTKNNQSGLSLLIATRKDRTAAGQARLRQFH